MVRVPVPSSQKPAPYMRCRVPVLGAGQREEQVQVPKPAHYISCRVPVPGADQLEEQVQGAETCISKVQGAETRTSTDTSGYALQSKSCGFFAL